MSRACQLLFHAEKGKWEEVGYTCFIELSYGLLKVVQYSLLLWTQILIKVEDCKDIIRRTCVWGNKQLPEQLWEGIDGSLQMKDLQPLRESIEKDFPLMKNIVDDDGVTDDCNILHLELHYKGQC